MLTQFFSTCWFIHDLNICLIFTSLQLQFYNFYSYSYASFRGDTFNLIKHISSVSSVTQLCLTLCDPQGLQHARSPCPSPTCEVYSNSCRLCQWCHPTISTSAIPFFSCPQSCPASGSFIIIIIFFFYFTILYGSFQMSQFFASGGQSIGVSASTSVLPMNIQDWFLLGWTFWISLQSKGLSRILSDTTVQMHQFFGTQLFL